MGYFVSSNLQFLYLRSMFICPLLRGRTLLAAPSAAFYHKFAVSKIHTLCKTVMTSWLTAISVFILVEASKMINHLFTRLWFGQPGNSFDSRHRQIFFLSIAALRLSLGPSHQLVRWLPRTTLHSKGRDFPIGCLVLKLQ